MWFVAEVGGVRFYEDSLATNPAAAAAAIRAFDRPLVLIAGGWRRGGTADDFRPMGQALRERSVRAVLLIGAMAPHLEEALVNAGLGAPVLRCGTLEVAVHRAREVARAGDVVTLSPGCESFDQFRDYRERGDRYIDLVTAPNPEAAGAAGGSGRWT